MLSATQFNKHLLYWLFPSLVIAVLIAMYFSGSDALQQFVAPYPRREFGVLENIQNLVLIAIIVMSVMGFRRSVSGLQKVAYAGLAAFTLLLLLEEIDYGLHYWEAWHGKTWKERIRVRNLHNQGDLTDAIKRVVDIGLVLFFVILPWFVKEKSNRWLKYITPSRYFTIAAVAMYVLSKTAHALNDAGVADFEGATRPMLSSNISEFRELFLYYVGMIHLWDITWNRQWPGAGGTGRNADQANLETSV